MSRELKALQCGINYDGGLDKLKQALHEALDGGFVIRLDPAKHGSIPGFMKSKKEHVNLLFDKLLEDAKYRESIQGLFLQGCQHLANKDIFAKLCEFIVMSNVWWMNIGEIDFKIEQIQSLYTTLQQSKVSFMFAKVESKMNVPGGIKDSFMAIVKENRKKHTMWKYGYGNHQIIALCEKNWWNPQSAQCNIAYVQTCRSCLLMTIYAHLKKKYSNIQECLLRLSRVESYKLITHIMAFVV